MGKGLFGGLFDFNHDGKMDVFETAAEFQFFDEVVLGGSSNALTDAGLDREELLWMDADERRETLEYAGLDSVDFDFDD